jgi:hypothetical protein
VINYCAINDASQGSLIARIVFINLLDAQIACERLQYVVFMLGFQSILTSSVVHSGAVADGQTLTVRTVPPTKNPFSTTPSAPAPVAPVASTSGSVASGPRGSELSQPQPQRKVAPTPTQPSQSSLSLFERMGNHGRVAAHANANSREGARQRDIPVDQSSLAQRLGLERTVPTFMPPTQVAPLLPGPKSR